MEYGPSRFSPGTVALSERKNVHFIPVPHFGRYGLTKLSQDEAAGRSDGQNIHILRWWLLRCHIDGARTAKQNANAEHYSSALGNHCEPPL
jgi:hypothetical protein